MCGIRAAVLDGRAVRASRRAGGAGVLQESGFVHCDSARERMADRWTARPQELAVDQRILPGRCREPSFDFVRQLRGRRHHSWRRRHWRDELQQRAVDAAREGDLPDRRDVCSRWSGSISRDARRTCGRSVRLLHRRDHVHASDCARHVRRRTGNTADAIEGRPEEALTTRSAETGSDTPCLDTRSHGEVHVVLARRRVQEDQVLHERERRLGRARSARAADAHDCVLADGAAQDDGGAAVCGRRSSRRRRGSFVCHATGGAAAADVRSSGHRHLDRQRRAG